MNPELTSNPDVGSIVCARCCNRRPVDAVDSDSQVCESCMSKTKFTTRAFERSHGRKPSSSTMGSWAFRASSSETAFESDLYGELVFVHMATLAEAKKSPQVRSLGSLVAVMP